MELMIFISICIIAFIVAEIIDPKMKRLYCFIGVHDWYNCSDAMVEDMPAPFKLCWRCDKIVSLIK